ncbi:HolB ATPase involved in DNA replication [Paracoccaceae bacterium]
MTKFEIKYEPQSLNDIVYPHTVIEQQVKAIGNGSCDDHILLYGPHGTGKTTAVKLMFEARYGCTYKHGNYFCGSDLTTVPVAKSAINGMMNFLGFQRMMTAGCVIVIDEVDMIPLIAQKYLRNFMQTFPFVRFMFTTNHETSVYTGIRSVCRLVEFSPPPSKLWLPRAQHILQAEGVQLPDANVLNMLSGVTGSARDVCRLLQDVVLTKQAGNVAHNAITAVPPSPPVPPASLTVTVTPPQQQPAPNAQPTP